ncbi:MAG: hypothetical protein ATN31_04150 [Candidatus Epulonipiscioides saccharophilum]|nr:MAG: hypothetical protein ATN31_04150 [Epulopiscium sp. AS2M-Bin001]
MNKKLIALAFCAMALTACGGSEDSKSDVSLTPNGTYPIVQEGSELTISVFAPLRGGVPTYHPDENSLSARFAEETGITFEYQEVPSADRQTKLNTLMTSSSYPDVILDHFWSASEQLLYAEQGIILPLNDLIAEYGPNIQKVLDAKPLVKDNITLLDGNIYSLPSVGIAMHMSSSYKLWINEDWLDNLGLDMPQTTEEFTEVLRAFKTKDANGNGDPNDEIPLSGSLTGWNAAAHNFLLNSFTYYSSQSKFMYSDNGQLVYSRTTDEFKDGVKYLNSLYEEGLIDELYFTQSSQQLQQVGNNPGDTILGSSTGGSIASFLTIGDSDRWLEYTAVPPLEGPDGVRNAILSPDYGNMTFAISSECESPEAVIRAWDLMFLGQEQDLFQHNLQGEYGIDYADAEPGAVNVLGEPAKYIRLSNSSEMGTRYWNQLGPWFRPDDQELWFAAKPGGDIEAVLYNETKNKYVPYQPDPSLLIPPLGFAIDESRELIDIEQVLNTYFDQTFAEFVTGKLDIDENWDSYVTEMNKIGLPRYLELYQQKYDETVK